MAVAQLVEHLVVAQKVADSSSVGHPNKKIRTVLRMKQDNLFKLIRNCYGLTLKEMSKKCGISAEYYSELERGIKKQPSDDIFNKLASLCDVSSQTLRHIHNNCTSEDFIKARAFLIKELINIAM